VSFLASSEEIKNIKKAFKELDVNQDGAISKEELLVGYKKLYGAEAEEMVERIFKEVDVNNDGTIEFTEWLAASIDKKTLLSDEKLSAAFKMFDKDGSGTISASELKQVIGVGKNIPAEIWDAIIGEVDDDGSKTIDFEEFKTMMMGLIDKEIKYK
jgi:calcium-dependent protein kinase